MAIDFEYLDKITRGWMLDEFLDEQRRLEPAPYRSACLSDAGWEAWQWLCTDAIRGGDEDTLAAALLNRTYWLPGTDVGSAIRSLALTEFNTWYVRGLARRLLEEGESDVRCTDPAEEIGGAAAAHVGPTRASRIRWTGSMTAIAAGTGHRPETSPP